MVFAGVVAGITVGLDCISYSAVATKQVIRFAQLFIADYNYAHGLICCIQLAVLDALRRTGYISLSFEAFGPCIVYAMIAFFYLIPRVQSNTFEDVADFFRVYSLPFLKFFLWNLLVAAVIQSNLPGYGTFPVITGWKNFLTDLVHFMIFNPMIIEISKGLGTIAKLLTSTSSSSVKHRKSDRWELVLVTVKVMLFMYCLLFVGMYACRLTWMNFTAKTSTQHPIHKLTTLVISAFCVLFGLTTFHKCIVKMRDDDSFAEIFMESYRRRTTFSGNVADSVRTMEDFYRIGSLPKKIISAASDDCVVCLESLSDLSSADCDDLDIASKVDKLQALGTRVFRCGHATHVNCWNIWVQQQQRQRATGPKKCLCCQAEVE